MASGREIFSKFRHNSDCSERTTESNSLVLSSSFSLPHLAQKDQESPLPIQGSPFITLSRGSSSRKNKKRRLTDLSRSTVSIKSSVSSLFEDLDPESSPLMRHLEEKLRSGARLTEEDFNEPYRFKKKMESEFNEIAEKFKHISIDNPEETISIISDEDMFVIDMTEGSSEAETLSPGEGSTWQSLADLCQLETILADDGVSSSKLDIENLSSKNARNARDLKTSLLCQFLLCAAREGLNYFV